MIDRTQDKDASVRLHACSALFRLQVMVLMQDCGDEEENRMIQDKLLVLLRRDTSSDVRKSILANIEWNTANLPSIFERARDVDASVRKVLYKKLQVEVTSINDISSVMLIGVFKAGLMDRFDWINLVMKVFVTNVSYLFNNGLLACLV